MAGRYAEVFLAALRLGLTSFGGPIAHLGYFRAEYVERRRWLDDRQYADLVALCQFLPGPASSQVGIAIGMSRAGLLGGLLSWLGFTLPSAAAMTAFALGLGAFDIESAGWLHGLQLVAVAVVAQAVLGMSRSAAADRSRASLAVLAAIAVLLAPNALTQVAVIALAGLAGWRLLPGSEVHGERMNLGAPGGRVLAVAALVAFFGLLVALPLARATSDTHALALFDSFYRVGSLVFGGGHVVLPLIQAETVPTGWVSLDQFTAGYGAAQAVPGPLFTFAAYLGAVETPSPNGIAGSALALVAVYVPSFLLLIGTLPAWDALRARRGAQAALAGVNAAVVGILAAALYDPVFTSAVRTREDLAVALGGFALLVAWRLPPWIVVALSALAGTLLDVRG